MGNNVFVSDNSSNAHVASRETNHKIGLSWDLDHGMGIIMWAGCLKFCCVADNVKFGFYLC